MLILTIRTDKPEAEIGLFNNYQKIVYLKWEAHKELSSTIHLKIKDMLEEQGVPLINLDGIVVFKGPGSFTGLRIGLSVANTLSYALAIPIVSVKHEQWIKNGIKRLISNENEKVALPEYGREPHITQQKH